MAVPTPHKLTLIYNQQDQGWTETFYRTSDTTENAADLPAAFFRASVSLRSRKTLLEATRSQQEGGWRRTFLDLAEIPQTENIEPANRGVCALVWLQFRGGYGRHLYLRGLPKAWVTRAESGRPQAPRAFAQAMDAYFEQIQAADLRGRLRRRDLRYREVVAFQQNADNPAYTDVLLDGHLDAAAGQHVYFSVQSLPVVRSGRNYWTVASEPGRLTIFHPWPAGLKSPLPARGRVKRLAFEYPVFDYWQFRGWNTYQPGGVYVPASFEPLHPRLFPLSPCGRIVEFLRQCYQVRMRPRVDDHTVADWVRWYFPTQHLDIKVLDNPPLNTYPRRVVPFAHLFGSRNWDLEEWPELPLGETYERTNWHHGRQRTILTGEGLAGRPRAWQVGTVGGDAYPLYDPRTGWP